MILIWLILLTMSGGILAWMLSGINRNLPRWISLIFLLIDFVLIVSFWIDKAEAIDMQLQNNWLASYSMPWIERFGISFTFAMDGLSLLMIILTLLLGFISVLISWSSLKESVGFFHFNLMMILAGIIGVFVAMDLFLFYFFWEVMLIPMYLIIGIWGHEKRVYAAWKFFLFTQASGLLMLLAILALYFMHAQQTNEYTFDYFALMQTTLPVSISMWLMLGFLIAFIVKLPVVPFHNWLPDAHTEAPTAGSVILAGLLLKTGAYGILRFVIPLFPGAAEVFAPFAMLLGVISILYGAKLAFAQTDLKRLVAYTSVSHMGFVILGAFSFNLLAYQGVVMQMITHGISTGALFIMAGQIQDRLHTRQLDQMGGFWTAAPKMGGFGLLFVMASLGLPGLGNFVAEFLILLGAFQQSQIYAILASLGLVASSVYAIRVMLKIFYGPFQLNHALPDLNIRETVVMLALAILIIWLGIYPKNVIHTAGSFVNLENWDRQGLSRPADQMSAKPEKVNGSFVEIIKAAK